MHLLATLTLKFFFMTTSSVVIFSLATSLEIIWSFRSPNSLGKGGTINVLELED